MNKRQTGSNKEKDASDYLKANGVKILKMNYRCRMGEIDIIGKDVDTTVFFEVKYRTDTAFGEAAEAVGFAKQKKISRVADHYRMVLHMSDYEPFRFDVVAIDGDEIKWYKNAFFYVPRG